MKKFDKKKIKKISIITAVILVFSGIILCAFTIMVYGTDLRSYQNNARYERESQIFYKDSINNISIDTTNDDVEIRLSPDDIIRIEYVNSDLFNYNIDVLSGNLSIYQKKTEWYKNIFTISFYNNFYDNKVILYVTDDLIESCGVQTVNGDISISGNIKVQKELFISSQNGDIYVSGVTVSGSSGLKEVTEFSGFADIMSVNGDINLNKVKAPCVNLNNTSGDITIDYVRAEKVDANTTYGDINGTVDMPYNYKFELNENINQYGERILPKSDEKGKEMILKSTYGDIVIKSNMM